MADNMATLKLKRKREGKEAQRKKAKTEKQSSAAETGFSNGTPANPDIARPGAPLTSEPSVSQTDAQIPQTNGVHEDPTPQTPSNSQYIKRKSKSKSKGQSQEEPTPAVEANDTTNMRENSGEALFNGVGPTIYHKVDVSGTKDKPPKEHTEKTNRDRKGEAKASRAVEAKEQNKQKKRKDKPSGVWAVSNLRSGWFLPYDPYFSRDEKYLLVAKLQALEVYSTETSLLAKALPLSSHSAAILAYALSESEPNHVYTADSTGIITLLNWVDGSRIGRWDIGANVRHLAVVTQPSSGLDLLYCHEAGKRDIINIHALRTGDQSHETEVKQIFKAGSPVTGLQVFQEGRVVVVSCADSVIIGKRKKLNKTALQDFEYVWREFRTSKHVTCFNAHLRIPDNDQAKKSGHEHRDHLDLAVGEEDGVIYLFEDVLTSLVAIEKSLKDSPDKNIGLESLQPRRLHWHREAVRSLKWSRDGNYLMSGGEETVITIWQLSTGKQQHLPHLTAAIESIVVSSSGASYAISLANNSVIVLSTSELDARTNVVGVQSRRIDLEQLPRESNLGNYSFGMFSPLPAVVDPKNTARLFFTAPSSQPRHMHAGCVSEPYLQTFDMSTQRAVSRQALTRNNATDPNLGPERRKIGEPSVKFLQVSHDGKWLATVDEWLPPRPDMAHLEEGTPTFNEEERIYRREVYLKFWQWDEQSSQWTLNTRIDAPHFFESVCAHTSVFDLVVVPSGPGFASVGEDRVIRIWRPKTRMQDGLVIRGADKTQGLVTWSLDRAIDIPTQFDVSTTSGESQDRTALRTCRICFSADGSALAAGVSWLSEAEPGVIHVIDADAGIIRRSITELEVSALSNVGIVGRYLVAVSGSTVTVWDMVLDQLDRCFSVNPHGINIDDSVRPTRLAINEADSTFAVSVLQFDKNETSKSRDTRRFLKASTKVYIYSVHQGGKPWSTKIPGAVLALTSIPGDRGYVALDSSSGIRIITPRASVLQLPTPPPEPVPQSFKYLTDVKEVDSGDEQGSHWNLDIREDYLINIDKNKPVVRPEHVQELFERGSGCTAPRAKDLFNSFVELYASKPRKGVRATGQA